MASKESVVRERQVWRRLIMYAICHSSCNCSSHPDSCSSRILQEQILGSNSEFASREDVDLPLDDEPPEPPERADLSDPPHELPAPRRQSDLLDIASCVQMTVRLLHVVFAHKKNVAHFVETSYGSIRHVCGYT